MIEKIKQAFKKKREGFFVSFSPDEFKQMEKDCLAREQMPQKFIKSCIFQGENKQPLMGQVDTKEIRTELKKIGVNVNQISRKVNSGHFMDWSDDFRDFSTKLSEIQALLVSHVYN